MYVSLFINKLHALDGVWWYFWSELCFVNDQIINLQCIYLTIYLYSPLLDLGSLWSFLILYTVGRTPWTGDQLITRSLPTHRINAHRHPCLEWDSDPRSQCLSGRRRFMPQIMQPPTSVNLQRMFTLMLPLRSCPCMTGPRANCRISVLLRNDYSPAYGCVCGERVKRKITKYVTVMLAVP
jgi:hypothetical protein